MKRFRLRDGSIYDTDDSIISIDDTDLQNLIEYTEDIVIEEPDTCGCKITRKASNEGVVLKAHHKCKAHESVADSNIMTKIIEHNKGWTDYFVRKRISDELRGKIKAKEKERSEKVPEIALTDFKRDSIANPVQ